MKRTERLFALGAALSLVDEHLDHERELLAERDPR